jgi:class 3 adenylate cyclase
LAGRVTGADQVELLLLGDLLPGLQRIVLHGTEEEQSLHGTRNEQAQWVALDSLPWLSAVLTGEKQIVNHLDQEMGDWASLLRSRGFASGMALPVFAGSVPIGVLNIAARFTGHFDKPTQAIVQEFAGTLGANLGLFRAMRALETNLDEADSVLTSVLPVAVTSRLKGGESQIADRIPLAGVFFCDLAGFTAYSSATEPEEVVAMLQEVFGLLEQDCARHQIEKIKTIGDAFMAVSGVSIKVDDPIETIASFALSAAELLRTHLAAKDIGLSFRVGIHAGTVLAGILGSDRLFFDIWGDTVNVASRLESSADAGEIRCSDRIREGLGEAWRFADCGQVQLKGKGAVQVWSLLGREEGSDSGEASD